MIPNDLVFFYSCTILVFQHQSYISDQGGIGLIGHQNTKHKTQIGHQNTKHKSVIKIRNIKQKLAFKTQNIKHKLVIKTPHKLGEVHTTRVGAPVIQ